MNNSSNENEVEDKKGRLESALNVHQTPDMAISEPIVSNPEIKITKNYKNKPNRHIY